MRRRVVCEILGRSEPDWHFGAARYSNVTLHPIFAAEDSVLYNAAPLDFTYRKRLTILLAFCVSIATAVVGDKTELAPEIFAPGVISADLDESCGSFSPDGHHDCG